MKNRQKTHSRREGKQRAGKSHISTELHHAQPIAWSDAIRGESLNNAQPPPWESAGPSQEPGLGVSPGEKQSSSLFLIYLEGGGYL